MPRRSSQYRVPRDWLTSGTWPNGTFAADSPEVVAHAVAIANALEDALGKANRSQVCANAGIQRSTLYDILAGRSWPDTVTLARLELELNKTLWPTDGAPPLHRGNRPADRNASKKS